jgi:hypothetical protein
MPGRVESPVVSRESWNEAPGDGCAQATTREPESADSRSQPRELDTSRHRARFLIRGLPRPACVAGQVGESLFPDEVRAG